jgi:hypothetical protein
VIIPKLSLEDSVKKLNEVVLKKGTEINEKKMVGKDKDI